MNRGWDVFTGVICAGGFASGDMIVVGAWRSSPLGGLVDVMWVRPDGERVLLAPREDARAYVAALYAFDRSEVVGIRGGWDGAGVAVEAGPLRIRLRTGPRDWRSLLFAARPLVLRRSPGWIAVEDRLARPLVSRLIGGAEDVRTVGRAPSGQQECYGIDDYSPVIDGTMTVDGEDAGPLTDLRSDLGVGLSSFPRRPAAVHVGTLVERR